MLQTSIRPRFCDTDALGHINNTVIPVWFLEAREPVLGWFAPNGDFDSGSIAVVRVEVDYLGETRFGEDVTVRTGVERIGNSSFVLLQSVEQNGATTARGRTTLVHFDAKTRRSAPIPDEIRPKLAGHMDASEERGA
jgi:acyl-CoA thioester hydrolase